MSGYTASVGLTISELRLREIEVALDEF